MAQDSRRKLLQWTILTLNPLNADLFSALDCTNLSRNTPQTLKIKMIARHRAGTNYLNASRGIELSILPRVRWRCDALCSVRARSVYKSAAFKAALSLLRSPSCRRGGGSSNSPQLSIRPSQAKSICTGWLIAIPRSVRWIITKHTDAFVSPNTDPQCI